jgi:glutathione S-transferase
MARVLLREHKLPFSEKEIAEFPPSDNYFNVNPLGQVPVLDDGSQRYFPTRIVLARIVAEAQKSETTSDLSLAKYLFREE